MGRGEREGRERCGETEEGGGPAGWIGGEGWGGGVEYKRRSG